MLDRKFTYDLLQICRKSECHIDFTAGWITNDILWRSSSRTINFFARCSIINVWVIFVHDGAQKNVVWSFQNVLQKDAATSILPAGRRTILIIVRNVNPETILWRSTNTQISGKILGDLFQVWYDNHWRTRIRTKTILRLCASTRLMFYTIRTAPLYDKHFHTRRKVK